MYKKEIMYLEEEQQEAIDVLDQTAIDCDMDTKDYNRRLAAIIICYRTKINTLLDENR